MSALPSEAFHRARSAIHRFGRPLDVALFECHFDGGDRATVRRELTAYQNHDGGFGRALEPDVRWQGSTPIATAIGLQYAGEIGLDAQSTIVTKAIDYLATSYRSDHRFWPPVEPEATEAPHAPWWEVTEVVPPTARSWPNPTAELLGYLWRYRSVAPEELLESVTARAHDHLDTTDIIVGDTERRYAILCWERALPWLPGDLARRVRDHLERTLAVVDWEAEMSEIPAFSFAFSPETTVANHFPDRVTGLLEDEVARQAPDGAWWPTWEWGQYEDVWEIAEREWAGKLTLECVLALDRFDKLDQPIE